MECTLDVMRSKICPTHGGQLNHMFESKYLKNQALYRNFKAV